MSKAFNFQLRVHVYHNIHYRKETTVLKPQTTPLELIHDNSHILSRLYTHYNYRSELLRTHLPTHYQGCWQHFLDIWPAGPNSA